MNSITVTGRLVKDLELKESEKAGKYCILTIADAQGKDRTAFIDCFATGWTAENLAKWFKKGSPITIVGELRQSQGKTKGGENYSKFSVYVEEWWFVPGSKNDLANIPPDAQDMPF